MAGSTGIDVYKEWLGIPEGPRPPDHYSLLRLVPFEDAVEKIRGNYKKLNTHVRKYASGTYSVQSQALLNELAKAMLCLTDEERKRDYDRSLGREVEEARGPLGHAPMENVLHDRGVITRAQIEQAREYAEKTGLDMRDALVQMKFTPPDVAAQALAEELGLPYVDLADMLPDDDVLDRVAKRTVKQNSIMPLFVDDDKLMIACVHQPTDELLDELRMTFDLPIRPVLATPLSINQAIAKYYAPGARQEPVAPTGKKGAKSAKTAAKSGSSAAVEKPPAKRVSDMTTEELAQRRMYGIIALCWSVIVPVMIDQIVIREILHRPQWLIIPYLGLAAPILTPIALIVSYLKFFGKR